MFPWGLLGQGLKAGLEIYKNKKAADVAMSEAKLLHIEKMKRGEIEYTGKIADNQKGDWKDEFVKLNQRVRATNSRLKQQIFETKQKIKKVEKGK
jgi:hypothetical protein